MTPSDALATRKGAGSVHRGTCRPGYWAAKSGISAPDSAPAQVRGPTNTASAKRVVNEGGGKSFGHRRDPDDLQATLHIVRDFRDGHRCLFRPICVVMLNRCVVFVQHYARLPNILFTRSVATFSTTSETSGTPTPLRRPRRTQT